MKRQWDLGAAEEARGFLYGSAGLRSLPKGLPARLVALVPPQLPVRGFTVFFVNPHENEQYQKLDANLL